MLRNRRSKRDFMGYHDNGMDMQPRMQPLPPISQLDAQSERLAEQAEDIGWLKAQNDMLNEDNQRLEQENQDLRETNKMLRSRNEDLERKQNEAQAGYKSGQQLVDEIEAALTAKKGAK